MYLFKSWGGGGGVVPRDGGDPDCEPRDSHLVLSCVNGGQSLFFLGHSFLLWYPGRLDLIASKLPHLPILKYHDAKIKEEIE